MIVNIGTQNVLTSYNELKDGLNDYFRTLVDEATDYSRFVARAQQKDEAIHQYAI